MNDEMNKWKQLEVMIEGIKAPEVYRADTSFRKLAADVQDTKRCLLGVLSALRSEENRLTETRERLFGLKGEVERMSTLVRDTPELLQIETSIGGHKMLFRRPLDVEGQHLPGWICHRCRAFNGEAKEQLSKCRACGAAFEGHMTRSGERNR